jgi:hypothetical protein
LKRENKANHGWNEEECTERVEASDMLESRNRFMLLVRDLKEEKQKDGGNGSDREIHIEAPSPSGMLGEDSAEEGTNN